MEPIKEQQPASGPGNSTRSKLRYPLRSASKGRDEKPVLTVPEILPSSASKRVRSVSNVSKSVNVLDLSGKDKSATKPPRRLSIPAKSTISPVPRPVGSVTPVSETRLKKSTNGHGKSDTPFSGVSKSTNKKKFCVLSSASYWITQIKLSESASKHLISLGFFKLALESGCEPLQRVRDELKSYARRNNLLELGEPAKELLRNYNILEELEQLQASDNCSQVVESSDEDSQASSKEGSLKPKSLSSENIRGSIITESAKKEIIQKKNPKTRNRASFNRNSVTSVTDNKSNMQKRSQRPSRQETNRQKAKNNNSEMKSACGKDASDLLPTDDGTQQEDKENMDDAPHIQEISLSGEL